MGVIRFRAQLQPRGPAAAVVLDDAQVAEVGEGARRFPGMVAHQAASPCSCPGTGFDIVAKPGRNGHRNPR